MSNVPLNVERRLRENGDDTFGRSTAIDGLGRPRKARVANRAVSRGISRALLYFVLVLGAIIFAYPFIWMLATSLKSPTHVYQNPVNLVPSPIDWGDYPQALSRFPFLQGLRNTLIITAGVMIGTLISVTLAAYAFARIRFPMRQPLFYVCLGVMMIPYQVILLPQYILFRELGWLNTFLPLIVPSFFAAGASGAFFIFMLRQFFLSIPAELDEAAMLDGCGRLRVLWHILLPEIKPALIVVGIFTFLGQWNDFFGPLIYLTKTQLYTLALDFEVWSQTQQSAGAGYKPPPFDRVMVIAAIITIVPVLIFAFMQRYFIRGIVIGGRSR